MAFGELGLLFKALTFSLIPFAGAHHFRDFFSIFTGISESYSGVILSIFEVLFPKYCSLSLSLSSLSASLGL